MAVYKVIQDVEAEDKLVGFLTLRTFIYAIIACTLGYINFRLVIANQLGPLRWTFVLLSLFPMLLFGLLALPLGRDQPTEIWLLSRLRFFIKPRTRKWDQSGMQELVTITAPKKVERQLTKNLSQTEVRSRLRALATTLDSRGWAVKNVAVNLSSNPGYLDVDEDSDRLVSASSVAQQQTVDVNAVDDIMDEQNNPTAQHFEMLMRRADVTRKEKIKNKVRAVTEDRQEAPDFEFLDQVPSQVDNKGSATFVGRKIVSPTAHRKVQDDDNGPEDFTALTVETGDPERDLLEKLHAQDEYVHAHAPSSLRKSGAKKKEEPKEPAKESKAQVTGQPQTDKLEELIETAKDYGYKVSTVEKLANRGGGQIKQIGPNEVEIDLH